MRKILLIIVSAFIVWSCTTSNAEETEVVVADDIVGTWQVRSVSNRGFPDPSELAPYEVDEGEITFNEDGTFSTNITYTGNSNYLSFLSQYQTSELYTNINEGSTITFEYKITENVFLSLRHYGSATDINPDLLYEGGTTTRAIINFTSTKMLLEGGYILEKVE